MQVTTHLDVWVFNDHITVSSAGGCCNDVLVKGEGNEHNQ